MIKWYYKPSGNCPVQAEGWFMGKYFYFRARWERAYIEFHHSKQSFDSYGTEYDSFILHTTEMYEAGWLSHRFCTFLVYKGCFKFLVYKFKKWLGYY